MGKQSVNQTKLNHSKPFQPCSAKSLKTSVFIGTTAIYGGALSSSL
jgi:hypothetical protein